MANNVTATQVSGQPKIFNDVTTIADLEDALEVTGLEIKVNGQVKSSDYELNDFDFVSFGAKVKGGC